MNPLCKTSNSQGACTSCYYGYSLDSTKTLCFITKDSSNDGKNFSSQSSSASSNSNNTYSNTNTNLQNNAGGSTSLPGTNNNAAFAQLFSNANDFNVNNCRNIGSNWFCQHGGFILQFSVQGNQTQLVRVVSVSNLASTPTPTPAPPNNQGVGSYSSSSTSLASLLNLTLQLTKTAMLGK